MANGYNGEDSISIRYLRDESDTYVEPSLQQQSTESPRRRMWYYSREFLPHGTNVVTYLREIRTSYTASDYNNTVREWTKRRRWYVYPCTLENLNAIDPGLEENGMKKTAPTHIYKRTHTHYIVYGARTHTDTVSHTHTRNIIYVQRHCYRRETPKKTNTPPCMRVCSDI